MQNYTIATLLNIIPLLGTINGIVIFVGDNKFDFELGIFFILGYILTANIIRLSRGYRTINISDNKIEYYNMFGLKRTIANSNIDLKKINVVRNFIGESKTFGPSRLFIQFKALFNLKHGGELRYKGKLIYRGLR